MAVTLPTTFVSSTAFDRRTCCGAVPRQVTARSSKEAPELAATLPSGENGSSPSPRKPPGNNGPSFNPKRLIRQFERKLSNLQFAILELAVLAALSGVGTVIEQEQVCDSKLKYACSLNRCHIPYHRGNLTGTAKL